MRKMTAFDFVGKQKRYNYKEMKEQIVTIYEEKNIKTGKVYLVDKGGGLALSFHNRKGIEKEYISGVVSLNSMDSAKVFFDSIN